MVEFKVGDIVKFKEGIALKLNNTRTVSNNCFYTKGTMEIIYLLNKNHVQVRYLSREHGDNYACRHEIELYHTEVPYDPEQMISEEDDL